MSKIRTGVIYAAVGAVALTGAATIYAQKDSPKEPQQRVEREIVTAVGPDGRTIFSSGPQIGVAIREVEPEDVTRLKLPGPGGVLVEEVRKASPADKAGVKAGDVIVEFDGERVRSGRGLTRLVTESAEGRAVKMAVVRDGRRTELTVTPEVQAGSAPGEEGRLGADLERLQELAPQLKRQLRVLPRRGGGTFNFQLPEAENFRLAPGGEGGPLAFFYSQGEQGRLGIQVQDLGDQLATYFGVKEGVLVAAVTDGSPAAEAGLKAGDIVTAINGKAVATADELVKEVQRIEGGADVTIGVTRDRKAMTLTAKIAKPQLRNRSVRPGRPT